jgi:hypothetical protein
VYWGGFPTQMGLETPNFGHVMGLSRFEDLKRWFHLRDCDGHPKSGQPGHDPLFRVRPFIQVLHSTFAKWGKLGPYISIDEAMFATKIRIWFRRTVKGKPTPTGIRVWVLCDTVRHEFVVFSFYVC